MTAIKILIAIALYGVAQLAVAMLAGRVLRHARRQSQALQHAGEVVGEGDRGVHARCNATNTRQDHATQG